MLSPIALLFADLSDEVGVRDPRGDRCLTGLPRTLRLVPEAEAEDDDGDDDDDDEEEEEEGAVDEEGLRGPLDRFELLLLLRLRGIGRAGDGDMPKPTPTSVPIPDGLWPIAALPARRRAAINSEHCM